MTGPDGSAIVAEGLKRTFGAVRALDGVDLQVPTGSVLGLLGPNGAGKTTAVRILTTLLKPTDGRAEVAGFDVVRQPDAVRRSIGLTGQYAAVDEVLTGRENLEMVGRLYHMERPHARRRAAELLEQFELAEAADRELKTYSGGMRRRLDLAASLVNRPQVLFLDEPTTGLDPSGRLGLWDVIEDLVEGGTTLLLTTQYLEEADRLADRISVIDHGRVIAEGTSDELKRHVGGDVLEFRVVDRDMIATAAGVMVGVKGGAQADNESGLIVVPVGGDATDVLVRSVRKLDEAGITIADLVLRRPTLDDVFLALTGHTAEEAAEDGGPVPAPVREEERV